MAFTDRCDIFGAVHENGINRVVRHIMRQRPSLFNYATPFFQQRSDLLCAPIQADKKVFEAGNPLFTEEEPLPILGAPVPIGVNFCVQLVDAQIDFHPGNVFTLPPELGSLSVQRFALGIKACAGIDCPPRGMIEELLPFIERYLVAAQMLAVGKTEEQVTLGRMPGVLTGAAAQYTAVTNAFVPRGERPRTVALPTRELACFCLELYAVGYFQWGKVPGSNQTWLKPRLEGLEIVDLEPKNMENALECYLSTVLRLGILPRLMLPLEKMVLDITSELREMGLNVGQQVNLEPSAVPADVPNNPAVEEDQLKAFVKLTIT
ncbi:MAG TPA: hypothetical protein VLH85_00660 [Levilinea sp.]|nr:hypothetical protein [Levilinea sp.]